MDDLVPMGAIPEDEFNHLVSQGKNPAQPSGGSSDQEPLPHGAIPEEEFNRPKYGYGSAEQMGATALEQGVSGLTLGASKVLETHGVPFLGIPAITTPEAIEAREKANPTTSALSNIVGTGGLITLSGGLGAFAKGASLAARIGIGALEGAGIGGANQIADDWSKNKSLDAQKIAGSAGLGVLLGGGGTALGAALGSGLKKVFGRSNTLAKVPGSVEGQAAEAADQAIATAQSPVEAPKTGVQPSSLEEISQKVAKAQAEGTATALPVQAELDDALSRVAMENPVNPLQRESLSSQGARDIYQSAKEAPGEHGALLQSYEGLQKRELQNQTEQTLKEISGGQEPIADAYQAGQKTIQAFTDQYQAEKEALSPIFENLKKVPSLGQDLLPQSIKKMTDAVPGIASMFDGELGIRPYKTAWGIDKATYNAVKEAVDSLKTEAPSFETLWNIRKGLDQHVDVLAQGQAPSQIRALKASLMDLMQESSNNPTIRDAFKRYAINEQQRQVIEKSFGASVGSPEFGQISKVKPELIGDKIFSNSATAEAAQNILPRQQFNQILSNWIAEAKAAATDKGAFSSNKFGSFLKRNQDALSIAFKENPAQLQKLKDLTTVMRILPDAPSINPSGTAKTLSHMILQGGDLSHKVKSMTWEGALASIPIKIADAIASKLKMQELNQYLAGQAFRNAQESALKAHVEQISNRIDHGIGLIFKGATGQTRKKMNER